MKKLFFFATMLLCFGIGQVWAETATLSSVSTKNVADATTPSVQMKFGSGDEVTCTVNRTGGANYPGFYTSSGIVRYYVNDVMTLSVGEGNVISEIAFTYTSGATSHTADVGTLSADGASWTGSANAVSFSATATVKINTITVTYSAAGPTPSGLSKQILDAVAGKAAGETATVDVTEDTELNVPAEAGLVNLVINGKGHKVTVKADAQITTQAGLTINNVNFDCAEGTLAPIALSATPDSTLWAEKGDWRTKYDGSSQKCFYNDNEVSLNGCNFAELKTSLISANNAWALKTFTMDGCVVQANIENGGDNAFIDFWEKSDPKPNGIKDITIKNSTLYNVVENNQVYIIRFSNNSSAQPQKVWGSASTASTTLLNNTFVNMSSNKQFGDQYPSKNNVHLLFKGNIFYNTWRLQKLSTGSVKDFTNINNAICGITNPVDGTDLKTYATEDTLLCTGEAPFVVPTEALDFTKIADLINNFAPSAKSYAGTHGFGDPRWAPEVKQNIKVTVPYMKAGDKVAPIITSDCLDAPFKVEALTPEIATWDGESLTAVAAGTGKIKVTQTVVAPFIADTVEVSFTVVPATEKPIAKTGVGIYRPLYGDDTNGYLLGEPTTATIGNITVTPTIGTNVEYADVPKGDLYDGLKHKVMANDNVFFPSVEQSALDEEAYFGFDIDIPADQPQDIDSLDVLLPVGNAYMWRVQITNEAGDTIWRSAGEAEGKDIKVNSYNQATCYTNQFIATRDTVKISQAAAEYLSQQSWADNCPNYSVRASEKFPVLKAVTGKYSVKVYYWGKAKKSLSYEKVFLHMSKASFIPEYHTVQVAEGQNYECIYTPDMLTWAPDNNQSRITEEYAKWVHYTNDTNGDSIVTGKHGDNCWMFIDPLTDEAISKQCDSSKVTNDNALYTVTVYNDDVRSMSYYVTGTDSVVVYYSSASNTAGAAILEILDEEGNVVATVTGADVAGKKSSGHSAMVTVGGLDKTQNYQVRVKRTEAGGDVMVYAVKFVDSDIPTGISDLRADENMQKGFADGKIYDLSGRRVMTPVKGSIYIINGKKFIAR